MMVLEKELIAANTAESGKKAYIERNIALPNCFPAIAKAL